MAAVVSRSGSREKRMSRAFSTVDSSIAVSDDEEIQKSCCNHLNIKQGSYLFLFLDCAIAALLFATVIIHIVVESHRSLIFIFSITVFYVGTALSAAFTWLAVRTERAAFLWVFIATTIATFVLIAGLGTLLVLENVNAIQTDVFVAPFFGFNDAKLSGSQLLTLMIAGITALLVGFLIWKLTILINFYNHLFENSADGRIRHVRNDTRLHRRRKSTPYFDRRSSVFPELEENKPKDAVA